MMRFSNSIAICIEALDQSEILTDRSLTIWAKLQHIAEEAVTALGWDDQNGRVNLQDVRVQLTIQSFEKQLATWKERNWSAANSNFHSLPSQSCLFY
jgi:hypothetical protein